MAIANSSGDQKRLSAEQGVQFGRVTSGMNKLPPGQSAPTTTEKRVKSDEADDAEVINTAKKQFAAVRKVEQTNRSEAVEDLKFLKGEQWSSADASARAAEGRPCITENRLPTFANQITNDQRQNRPSINVSPMGGKASIKDAKMLRGMIRAIERDSHAEIAYDTGFQSAVHNGWGYWRVMTEFENEKSFNKVIVLRPVPNPMNVYLDSNRTPFMLDAKWGFVSEMLPRAEFTREYPTASQIPWGETGVGENDKDWVTPEAIRVAEYFWTVYEERELVMLSNGHEGWEDELDEFTARKFEVVERRTVQTTKIKWCKMTAIEVLERGDCDGQYIPIIECLGTVLNVNGETTKKGIVRDAKGPQRMSNYYVTLEAEHVALQPKAPWIMEEGQIEGHEQKWKDANRKSFSYLLYKGVNLDGKAAPPPQRQAFTGPPQAILAAKQGTVEALKAVTGIRFDATMSERMKDESGRAIRELNNNANLGAYHYIDNYARALVNTATVIIDLIPYTYDTKRIVSILDDSGQDDQVMINPNMQQPYAEVQGENGQRMTKMYNPKIGRYQVTVTIGPSYATKRVESSQSQMDFLRAVPAAAPMMMDLVAKNSDWEGADEIAKRLAKGLSPNLLTPDRADMTPEIQALVQSLQKQAQDAAQTIAAMKKELDDRAADRAVLDRKTMAEFEAKQTATEKSFEAKVLALGAKMEDISAKRDATLQGTIGRQLAEIAKTLGQFQSQSQIALASPVTPQAGSNP
jgi:hypothetical protein